MIRILFGMALGAFLLVMYSDRVFVTPMTGSFCIENNMQPMIALDGTQMCVPYGVAVPQTTFSPSLY